MAKAKKSQPESKLIRYLFYSVFVLLFVITYELIVLYNDGALASTLFLADSSITISLIASSGVFCYLMIKGNDLPKIIKSLGLSIDRLTKKSIVNGIILFIAIIILEIAITIFSNVTNIPLPTNVSTLFNGLPVYFFVFTVLIGPVNEEIFFRGFLVPRIGIVPGAIIFALLHAGYNSYSELFGAFVFGLLAGYVYKKNGSLYSTILAHMGVNALTVLSLFS